MVASRRYEAAGWLRKMVGVVAAKDLPAEPSEEEFRLGLRSGIILCNVLNKVKPGAVPKVNFLFYFILVFQLIFLLIRFLPEADDYSSVTIYFFGVVGV